MVIMMTDKKQIQDEENTDEMNKNRDSRRRYTAIRRRKNN
jgi:hypothetical protein